jgi:hypothetical protein
VAGLFCWQDCSSGDVVMALFGGSDVAAGLCCKKFYFW